MRNDCGMISISEGFLFVCYNLDTSLGHGEIADLPLIFFFFVVYTKVLLSSLPFLNNKNKKKTTNLRTCRPVFTDRYSHIAFDMNYYLLVSVDSFRNVLVRNADIIAQLSFG